MFVDRTQATEPFDGAQVMLGDSQPGKIEGGWVTLALSCKGKRVQEQSVCDLTNLAVHGGINNSHAAGSLKTNIFKGLMQTIGDKKEPAHRKKEERCEQQQRRFKIE